jgi:hypothetical protein
MNKSLKIPPVRRHFCFFVASGILIFSCGPAGECGQINSVIKDHNKTIEIRNVILALDAPQTLKARTLDSDAADAITRITNEIKSLEYK